MQPASQLHIAFSGLPAAALQGPPGTGKTTSILCLAHELLGPCFKEAVLELNASDDRGIDVVRAEGWRAAVGQMGWCALSVAHAPPLLSSRRYPSQPALPSSSRTPTPTRPPPPALHPQVRNKIKMFAQQKVTLPPGRQKIVILDEADR